MTGKQFHIGDLLSITDGRLMSLKHMDGVYELLNFMSGDNLHTHQLGRVRSEVESYLFEQHPWLHDVVIPDGFFENWPSRMLELETKWGAYHMLIPMHADDHEIINPYTEMTYLVDESKILTFNLDDEDDE